MSDQVIEFEKPKMIVVEKKLLQCVHCNIATPHWLILNGNYMCGFCGTEHAIV